MKKLIVFDLDGTLAESKSSLDAEMAGLLGGLLATVKVAVISGGNWQQFQQQLLANLPQDEHLKNLSLLPTCGTKFYQFESDWQQLYAENFTAAEKSQLIPEFSVRLGGTTSVDVTKPGIDKAYGLRKLRAPGESKRGIEAIVACLDGGR